MPLRIAEILEIAKRNISERLWYCLAAFSVQNIIPEHNFRNSKCIWELLNTQRSYSATMSVKDLFTSDVTT